jgi:hypothetical protein
MSKFVVIAGSRPKRAWAGVFEIVAGKQWFECESVSYYETGCSMWDECDTCSFDNDTNTASVLAQAGMVLTGEQVWLADTTSFEGGMFAPVVAKA